jgi:hypothetical protein
MTEDSQMYTLEEARRILTPEIQEQTLDTLALDWRLIRAHHPVGEYLPIGQMDGDCRCGAGLWPCAVVRARVFLGVPDRV